MDRILVVDDEPNIVKLLEIFLKLKGFEVLGVTSGIEALEVIQSNNKIDFVITDIMMPEISGAELLKKIAAMNKRIPVIILSGAATIEESDKNDLKSLDYMIKAVLGKPMDLLKLLEIIKKTLYPEG